MFCRSATKPHVQYQPISVTVMPLQAGTRKTDYCSLSRFLFLCGPWHSQRLWGDASLSSDISHSWGLQCWRFVLLSYSSPCQRRNMRHKMASTAAVPQQHSRQLPWINLAGQIYLSFWAIMWTQMLVFADCAEPEPYHSEIRSTFLFGSCQALRQVTVF